jgi:hypothetical protein
MKPPAVDVTNVDSAPVASSLRGLAVDVEKPENLS